MPKTEEKLTALKSEQLPQYLASLGLKPNQITAVIYGIFKEVKLAGTLTPSEDNAIHLTKENLLKMAKDPLLDSSLCDLFIKVQRMKSWDALFKKGGKLASLSAPGLWHNPSGSAPKLPENAETPETVEVVDFMRFLMECGIYPSLYLEQLEDELKKVWKEYGGHGPIKGAHTEIQLEPRALLGDGLNPEIAGLLASVYLSKTTIDDVNRGKIELHDQAIVIKDKNKKPVAIIRSQKAIQEFRGRLGI